jgi:general stress protein 26
MIHKKREEMKMEIVKKAIDLLGRCSDVTLASVNENGYPRICVMSKCKAEGVKKIYMSTGTESKKTAHFKVNPKASVCARHGGDCMTLIGTMEVTRDPALRKDLWKDDFFEHFPGGIDDPTYTILVFTTEEATLWIDHEFVTVGSDQL